MKSSQRPLEGTTVISLEHAVAAPLCTRHLADLGARVIKIERPKVGDFARQYDERVDGLASHFVWINRSKESLTLNLKEPEGMEIMQKLLAEADVLVQNLAPGATKRLGLDYESLAPEHPQLIVCDISGYGEKGPYTTKKAYDLLVQSEAGFLSVTGTPETPSKAGISIADIAAGIYAYNSILAALLQRHKTQQGGRIEVSMLEALAEWMGFPLYYSYKGAEPPARAGASHAAIYPYGPFTAGDGRSVILGLQNEREWKIFCEEVLEQPELTTDPRFDDNSKRSQNREQLDEIIHQAFADLRIAEVIQRLEKAGIANGNLNSMQDLWQHPQLQARQRWTHIESPIGTLPALLPPGVHSSFDYRMDPVPALGEHSEAILEQLGYTADTITQLREREVI
ncbi:MAG TPA: CaiB/BaiF CoA-transferase family protein [Paenalcaligenes sp.]|nr:CaiB/BaiF CoA-transferase family protein [Paenalcaligenes sp.]